MFVVTVRTREEMKEACQSAAWELTLIIGADVPAWSVLERREVTELEALQGAELLGRTLADVAHAMGFLHDRILAITTPTLMTLAFENEGVHGLVGHAAFGRRKALSAPFQRQLDAYLQKRWPHAWMEEK
jgi:hypothetical protein